jgi:hypothetical protein
MYNKRLTGSLSSKEINELVESYRAGDIIAAEQLLECFKPLIGKYLNVLFHGKYNQNDVSICKFLELCGKIDIARTAEIIKVKLRRYEASELINISKIALLSTAKYYDNITNSYKYVLHSYLKAMLWEDHIEESVLLEDCALTYFIDRKDVMIDNAWIKGDTSGPGFSLLTEEQRLIVKLCYYDNIPDIHVATRLKLTPYALGKEKEKIKEILAKALNIKP